MLDALYVVCNRITTVDLGTQSQCVGGGGELCLSAWLFLRCCLAAVGDDDVDDVDDVDDDADADRDITETFSLFLLPYSWTHSNLKWSEVKLQPERRKEN